MVKIRSKSTPIQSIRHWSPEEHDKFVFYTRLYGTNNWKAIAQHVGTRDNKQCRSHYQKFEKRLKEAWGEDQVPQSEKFQQNLHENEPVVPEIREIQTFEKSEPENSPADVTSDIQVAEESQFQNNRDEGLAYVEEFPCLAGTPVYSFHDFLPEGDKRETPSELDESENFWEMLEAEQEWVPLLDYLLEEV